MSAPTTAISASIGIAVPYTSYADGFECLIDVCEKNDPHFMYSKEKVEGNCKNFSKKDGR